MRNRLVLALQLAALAALACALLGVALLDARSRPRLLVLLDRSLSMPRAAADSAVAAVLHTARAAGIGDVQLLEFAAEPAAIGPAATAQPQEPSAGLDASATNIEAALQAALAAHVEHALDGVVVISDGHQNVGDATTALRAMRDARLPLQWLAVGRPPPPAHVLQVLAPARTRVGQRLQIAVHLAGQLDLPLRVVANARHAGGETQSVNVLANGADRVTIELDASRSGVLRIDLALQDATTAAVLDAMPDAAAVDIVPPATILYAQAATGSLARSLLDGGWKLHVVAATQLDAQTDALAGYQAVVLDDVAVADASPRFWKALVAAVRDRGLGLLVLGGDRSFARGGYRDSMLESVLPVTSAPAALDQPLSIVFAVDKSGSMGQGSGGVDRFQLAQRAVLGTARRLGERDALGLLVFDMEPQVLIPLGPAPTGVAAIERAWPVGPHGGTRLAPAIEAAIDMLEHAAGARRMLVIVTDGFTENVPFEALRARLVRSRIETIALAMGPDADVAALQRLVDSASGAVLRVTEAAELTSAMGGELEHRRARVERGTIAVEQRSALPFAPGLLPGWPAVAAHAVTRPQAQATVPVQSRSGEPLIAFQRFGNGRSAAVTTGFGPWSPRWLAWREWPRLAGGLAEWVSGASRDGSATVLVSDLPGSLQIDADVPVSTGLRATDGVSMVVDTPTAQGQVLAPDNVAVGRWRAVLPSAGPGLYSVVVTTPSGSTRQLHLRRQLAENQVSGIHPALEAWRGAGLVTSWDPGQLVRLHDARAHPIDRSLVLLGLALFLAAVCLDRARLNGSAVMKRLRRWRLLRRWQKRQRHGALQP